jgi:hypothetical protein
LQIQKGGFPEAATLSLAQFAFFALCSGRFRPGCRGNCPLFILSLRCRLLARRVAAFLSHRRKADGQAVDFGASFADAHETTIIKRRCRLSV